MKKLSLLIFVLVLPLLLFSQSISVKSFHLLENDMSARIEHPKTDQNGEKAALIKVVTTQTGFEFDGGSLGIVGVEQNTAEIWVYVPRGAKAITIKHPKLGILRNYAFPVAIVAASVYELELVSGTVETIVKPNEIETQWLAINSKPEGASVFIEEQLVGITPFSRKYPEGDYSYRLELPRYNPQAGNVNLVGEKKVLELILKPHFGSIKIGSIPENGMQIYLDDENTGKTTPVTLEGVASGERTLKLMSQWYQPQSKRVTVSDEETTPADFNMTPVFADITVTTNPTADILIDGNRMGNATYTARMLAGIYTIKAEKEKHYPDQQQVTIVAGGKQTIALNLKPMIGALDVASTPFDATITLNGKDYGTTPNTIKNLLVGDYTLTIKKAGYGTVTRTVTVTENTTAEVNETLLSGLEVTIASTPTGAQLTVDSATTAVTPYTSTLGFGNHTVKLVNGKKVVEKSISITQNGKAQFEFNVSELANFTEPSSGLNLEMVAIPGGTFLMGSPAGEEGRGGDETQHSVTLSPFYIGKYEVTQAQWRAVMGSSPSATDRGIGDSYPVYNVSWDDVQEFLRKLNQITGKTYRLPTEAEWEYAARSGTSTPFSTGNNLTTAQANYDGSYPYNGNAKGEYREKIVPVGSFASNAFGLYDMHGNVWEWCSDWYGTYPPTAQNNPTGSTSGNYRVFRGGGWNYDAQDCRSAFRSYGYLDHDYDFIGFRIVLIP